MTEYHNVDITIAAQNGTNKTEIKDTLKRMINHASNENLEECVMVSKIEEVDEK